MNYRVLADELQQTQYAALSDAEAAAALNAETVQVRRAVPRATLVVAARGAQITLAMRMAMDNSAVPATVRAGCAEILSMINDQDTPTIDLDHPTSQQMFAMLQQAGVINAQQAALIDALADSVTSRAAQLGLGYVSPGDVQQARFGGYA